MSLPNNLTAILVDDEPKAIKNLSFLLQKHCPNITVLATYNGVDEAVKAIEIHQPDVVFLDIEMPEKSGFELFEETNKQFQTIFVTAYDEFALKAFEVSAVDYLLKPIEISRLKKAVGKLQKNVANENISVLQKNIASSVISQIIIPYKDTKLIIKVEDIICFEANASYCRIYYEVDGIITSHIYSKSLRYFYELLNDNLLFFRSHRSWLINLAKVVSYSKKENEIILTHQIRASLSKSKTKQLEFLL